MLCRTGSTERAHGLELAMFGWRRGPRNVVVVEVPGRGMGKVEAVGKTEDYARMRATKKILRKKTNLAERRKLLCGRYLRAKRTHVGMADLALPVPGGGCIFGWSRSRAGGGEGGL